MMRAVYLLQFAVLAEPEGALDGVARQGAQGSDEGLPLGAMGILAPADPRHQHGRAPQGPLADVRSPYHHHHSHLGMLRLPLLSRGQPCARSHGCRGSFLAGMLSYSQVFYFILVAFLTLP